MGNNSNTIFQGCLATTAYHAIFITTTISNTILKSSMIFINAYSRIQYLLIEIH